jgi:hypothetical protein
MRKISVTIHGKLEHATFRTIEIEVPEDENVNLWDLDVFNDMADAQCVEWVISEPGYLSATDHTIEEKGGRS